jgi:outer membrane lipoprotein LolB
MRAGLAALAAAALLAACAGLPTGPAPERVHSGRFSLTADNGTQRENVAGRFTLAVLRGALTLDLATPLGTTLASLHSDARGAVLTVAEAAAAGDGPDAPPAQRGPRELRGPDAEALALDTLGWTLPFGGIRDWILGRPAPGQPVRQASAEGFEQDGWTIRVLERFEGSALPRRLLFERAAQAPASGSPRPAPAITLRLVLDAPVASPPAASPES